MPKTHFYHGNVHLALDSYNGEILAIRNLTTGDNLIKNAMCAPATYVYQPFTFKLSDGKQSSQYHPLYSRETFLSPEKRVQITSEETTEGLLIKVAFPCVTSQVMTTFVSTDFVCEPEKELSVDLYYTILITENGLRFALNFNNNTGKVLEEMRFPVIGGVFLGEAYTDNVLVYPRTAGMKNKNPIEWFAQDTAETFWRWNEYRYGYTDGLLRCAPAMESRGMRGYAEVYPGTLSMSWFDIYNSDGGIYYGVHNPDIDPVILECGTYGKKSVGLNLASNYPVRVNSGEAYTTPPTHLIFHDGDWHKGAQIYRAFRYPLVHKCENVVPSWAKDSVGLSAHYDFKIQDGTWYHTYKDIPQMARDSLAMGIDHMLFAGWHKDGFDNGYPLYYTDPDLGTEEEFIDGIRQAKDMGVHISLYENSQLYSLRYDKGDVADRAVQDINGKMVTQSWGINSLAVMCAMAPEWQDEISANVQRATRKYGVDGIYYDQFCNYRKCYNPNHKHKDPDWITARMNTVIRCREEYQEQFGDGMMTMGEWVCDAFGGIMTYQLTQSFFVSQMGFFTDMFRYTFPEFGLVDMVYPENVLMRPPQFAAREEILATCFGNDSYFWLYHIGDDINYFKDERSLKMIQEVNALNKIKKQSFADYRYVDTDGIRFDETVAHIRRYNLDKCALLKVYRFTDADSEVILDENIKKATAITSDNKRVSLRVKKNRVRLPKSKVCLLLLKLK